MGERGRTGAWESRRLAATLRVRRSGELIAAADGLVESTAAGAGPSSVYVYKRPTAQIRQARADTINAQSRASAISGAFIRLRVPSTWRPSAFLLSSGRSKCSLCSGVLYRVDPARPVRRRVKDFQTPDRHHPLADHRLLCHLLTCSIISVSTQFRSAAIGAIGRSRRRPHGETWGDTELRFDPAGHLGVRILRGSRESSTSVPGTGLQWACRQAWTGVSRLEQM